MIYRQQEQLHWFISRLLLLKDSTVMDPICYDEYIWFPVELFKKEKAELFPLGRYGSSCHFDSEEEEYSSYGEEILKKVKSDIYKLNNKGLSFNEEKFSWTVDRGFHRPGYSIFIDCDHAPLLEAYLKYQLGINTGVEADAPNNKVVLQKTKKKQLQLPDLPANLRWEEIIIRFLNGGEVQITAKGLIFQTNAESMGFQDEKSKKPNLQWALLKILSSKNGYLNWDNNKELDIKTRGRVKKQKQELSERLKVYFHSVEGDPFFDYKQEGGYKIKIQLIPEQSSDVEDAIKDLSDTIDYYNEDDEISPEEQYLGK